ncbi:phosphoribosyltransferase [Microbacterium sp. F51-2R]|uniref:phosphoribosyltransferase n=1 Tax=Microbacterium sp. F51-2R TaxID=3445777 RepID=UPI003FA0C321
MQAAFRDRTEAGRLLAARLSPFAAEHPVVLGLPRGGVPVAFEVAAALSAPLDVIVVRKLGVPDQPELAMGAIGENGVRVVDDHILRITGVQPREVDRVEQRERAELERRVARYRGDRARVSLQGRVVILVDDGIATGSTARAACRVARALGASRIVLAAPVGPPDVAQRVADDADEVICVSQPEDFSAVGSAYQEFAQTSDEEVEQLLAEGAGPHAGPSASAAAAEVP